MLVCIKLRDNKKCSYDVPLLMYVEEKHSETVNTKLVDWWKTINRFYTIHHLGHWYTKGYAFLQVVYFYTTVHINYTSKIAFSIITILNKNSNNKNNFGFKSNLLFFIKKYQYSCIFTYAFQNLNSFFENLQCHDVAVSKYFNQHLSIGIGLLFHLPVNVR